MEKDVRKITINFPIKLWKQLAIRSIEEDKSRTAIILKLVRWYLNKEKD